MAWNRRLKFKLRRKLPLLGKLTPEFLRLYFHRSRYRRRIASRRKELNDFGPRLPNKSRVDFMVAGAQKAGTTALMNMLNQHPDVVIPVLKEPHFFDNDGFFEGDEIPISEYHKAFPYSGDDVLYCEGTPRIMFAKRCVDRVKRYNPDLKLICIIRNPVTRAYSAWNMNHGRVEERSFREVIEVEKKRIEKSEPLQRGYLGYLSRSMYAHQIKRLRASFPDSQLKFIRYDRFQTANEEVVNEVFDFLGLDKSKTSIQSERSNVYRYHHKPDPSLEKELKEWFVEDIEAVEEELGWDLSDWKT